MAIDYRPSAPDGQTIRLYMVDSQVELTRWISYDFADDFLTPTDWFHFTIGDEELPEKERAALKLGSRVRLYVDSITLMEGYIDSIEIAADRHGGLTYAITGRDRLGQTLDAVADPQFQLKDGGSLADLLKRLFAPFGWSQDSDFEIDNRANRDAKSGIRGTPTSKAKGKPLKSYTLHQTKPYNHESVFHFASRVAQRHGLWPWASADGEKLIVGQPDYDQEPIFVLRRSRNGRGNILSGSVRYELSSQPSIIVADSFSGGGEFGKGRCKAYVVNPLLGFTDRGDYTDDVKEVLKKHPSAVENSILHPSGFTFSFAATQNVPFRPMYLHDDESKTQEQLNNFVKREMSLHFRKALTVQYTVEGHGQDTGDGFVAWTPDTLVDVYDEAAELYERLYVLGVHYSKQRGGTGTTTRLDLIRINSIVFGDPPTNAPATTLTVKKDGVVTIKEITVVAGAEGDHLRQPQFKRGP